VGATVPLRAEASDSDGFVQHVTFLVDGSPVAVVGVAPYQCGWSNATVGIHEMAAFAADNGGASRASAPVRITIYERAGTAYGLRRELYLDIPGRTLADLTNCARFPAEPDLIEGWSRPFEVSNLGSNYGMRLRGYVLAPADGDYVFYLAADDQAALHLSTDKEPVRQRQIAFVPDPLPPRQWIGGSSANASHISAPIPLQAGHAYYVEVLMKQGDGDDHVAVTWQLPGQPAPTNGAPPIPLQYLRRYEANDVVTNSAVYLTAFVSSLWADEAYTGGPIAPRVGRIDLIRHGPTNLPLTVNLYLGGIASNDVDYEALPQQITIPAGVGSHQLVVIPINDAVNEGPETVTVTILPCGSCNPPDTGYRVGLPSLATVTILDDEFRGTNSPPAGVPLVMTGAEWKYHIEAVSLHDLWRMPGFDDRLWPSGPSSLGDANGDDATELDFNGALTSYFRRRFVVDTPDAITNLVAWIHYMDGAVVYLNGVEAFRVAMPGGNVTYSTLATPGPEDAGFWLTNLSPGLLVPGTNVLAVETHLADPENNEIRFDMCLVGQPAPPEPPVITQAPCSQTKCVGQTATFTVTATGTPPLRYQWQFNRAAIPDATDATLMLLGVQTNQAGLYSVVVSNAVGSVTSSNAVLTVLPPFTMAATLDAAPGVCSLQLRDLGGHTPIVIEASTNLVNWESVYTNTLPAESWEFHDSINRPVRFYRAVLPTFNP
jgi:hypothetical protein